MNNVPSIKNLFDALINSNPSSNVVSLRFKEYGHIFNKSFIEKCLEETELKSTMVESGIDELTNLEKLAILLLFESAGFTIDK